MDHNKRTALLTAIDLGNLTRAAEQLGYTQSGLSYIIKSVEAEFGFPLLIRSRSGVRPTALPNGWRKPFSCSWISG